MTVLHAPSSARRFALLVPPPPAVLLVEPYPGIRMIFPSFLTAHLPGADALVAGSLEEVSSIMETEGHRIRGFVTNGWLSREDRTAHDTVDLVDRLTDRELPFVVLTALPSLFPQKSFRRSPIALIEKSIRRSMTDCILPLRPHVFPRRYGA